MMKFWGTLCFKSIIKINSGFIVLLQSEYSILPIDHWRLNWVPHPSMKRSWHAIVNLE